MIYVTTFGAELHRSCCLCRPGKYEELRRSQGGHMCVTGMGGLWLKYEGCWWRISHPKSYSKVVEWLEICDNWNDIIDVLSPEKMA